MAVKHSDRFEFTDAEIHDLYICASVGVTNAVIAAKYGISKDTLERRMKEDPRVSAALSKGRADCMGFAVQSLYDEAFRNKNATLMIFWMKTRGGWKESGMAGDDLRDSTRAEATSAPSIKWNVRGVDNPTPEALEKLRDEWIDKPGTEPSSMASGDTDE